MKLSNKIIIIVGIVLVLALLAGSALIAYKSSSRSKLVESFKKLYPAAIVDGKPVSIAEADEFISLASRADDTSLTSKSFQTFLLRKKSEALVHKLGIKIPSDAASDELTFITQGNQDAYKQLLSDYFNNNENLFKSIIVDSSVIEANLRIKYNSDFSQNQAAYKKAQDMVAQLKSGAKFDDLAKANSDDKQSAQFGGDLGFFQHGQILPELERQIVVAKTGEVSDILITRDGYEIVLPIEMSDTDGVKKWHAKHILVATSGFDQWLTNQTNSIPVKILKHY
jgi:hypothetical protein